MEKINLQHVQEILDSFANEDVYIHVEITNGVYNGQFEEKAFNAGMFIRNTLINYSEGKILGDAKNNYRVGLKLQNKGWVYVMGLTHYVVNENDEFIMHGFDDEGKLRSALEISKKEFFK